ncbi:SCO family protein [Pseudomonas sp. LFM046]|uniref:SCO family protein n=1 Tax=Pseudomonas sp. LFM046 TaxID=1608357 RepID=UPI000696544D|nr:SCO family protein [Pseudomonas sp. LFM046]
MGCVKWLATLVAVVLLSGEAALGAQPWGPGYFPDVPLVTQDGKTVHLYQDLLKGKKVAINMIFTSCADSCPLSTANLARVQKELGDQAADIHFYSITVDPETDTPQVLKAYAEKFHAGPNWLFLTGKEDDIRLAQKKLGLWSSTDAEDPDAHLTSLTVGNEPTGQWMRQSTLDNPRFLAAKLSTFLMGWQNQRGVAAQGYSAVPAIEDKGAGFFLFRRTCAACHTIGKGEALGPDLKGVTTRRDKDWLRRFIKAPDQMLEQRDPIAVELFNRYNQVRMPNLKLGDEDVEALIHYLEQQGATPPGQADSLPAPPPPGGG